jgi:hypothetical protein
MDKIQAITDIGKSLYYAMMTYLDLFSHEHPKDMILRLN